MLDPVLRKLEENDEAESKLVDRKEIKHKTEMELNNELQSIELNEKGGWDNRRNTQPMRNGAAKRQ